MNYIIELLYFTTFTIYQTKIILPYLVKLITHGGKDRSIN